MKNIKVTLVRGLAGKSSKQIEICQSLGLKKVNQTKIHPNNEATKGKLVKVSHLVQFEEVK